MQPFVIYFRKEPDVINTEHENRIMILDHSKHYSILVHTFQCHLMKFIENTFKSPLKKSYFSDGSAAQYKNKKITEYYMPQ
jgi:hypothetical protein